MPIPPSSPPSPGHARVTFSSELMKNYAPELPVDAAGQIEAVQEGNAPRVFSIGTDGVLYTVARQDGTPTGWVQQGLSEGLGTATALAAADAGESGFALAMAATKDGASRLYLRDSADFSSLAGEALDPARFWTTHDLPDPAARVDQVRVDGWGALVATSRPGTDARFYTVDSAGGVHAQPLPEDGAELLQMSPGTVYGERGAFLLYRVGAATTMLFQGFDYGPGGKRTRFRFRAAGAIQDFAVLPGEDGDDRLLTAGDAVCLFTAPGPPAQTVVTAVPGRSFSAVRAAAGAQGITLWLRGSDPATGVESLYYVAGTVPAGAPQGTLPAWTAPLPQRAEVAAFAPVRGGEVSNHLFLVSARDDLAHLWQDAATGLWHDDAVHVHDTGHAREMNTYTVQVQFTPDAPGNSVAWQPVKVSATAAVFLTLNGAAHRVGPQTAAEVVLDAGGMLNVVVPTDSLAAPTLVLAAEILEAPVSVPLMHNVQERLRAVTSGEALKTATRYDPTARSDVPLFSSMPDDETLNALAGGVQHFSDAADRLGDGVPSGGGADDRRRSPGDPPDAGPLEVWALRFARGGGVTLYQDAAARAELYGPGAVQARNILDDLETAFGDAVLWIRDRIDDVEEFVVEETEEAVRFAIRIGSAVFRFVLRTAQEVFAALELVFRKVALTLETLVQWLGYLFDWADILATKDALVEFFNGGFDAFAQAAEQVRKELDRWFDRLQDQWNGGELGEQVANVSDPGSSLAPPGPPDPRLQWVASLLPHLLALDPPSGGAAARPNLLDDTVMKAIESVVQDFLVEYHKVEDKVSLWLNGQGTVADVAATLLHAAGALVLELAHALVDAVLGVVEAAAAAVKHGLTAPVDIPLLSALYRTFISDADLSLLDAVCLLVAVPLTVICKSKLGGAPFASGGADDLLASLATATASSPLLGGGASSGPQATASGVHAASPAPSQPSAPPAGRLAARGKANALPQAMTAAVRMLRALTATLLLTQVLPAPAATPGTSVLVVVDRVARALGAMAALVVGPVSALGASSAIASTVFMLLDGGMYFFQDTVGPCAWTASVPQRLSGALGSRVNVSGLADALCVSAMGIWGLVDTAEAWGDKTDASRASELANELFQVLALPFSVLSAAARAAEGASAPPVVAALALGATRVGALGVSAVSAARLSRG